MHSSYAAILICVDWVSRCIVLVVASLYLVPFKAFSPFGELVKAGKERNAVCLYYSCITRAIKQAAKVLNVLASAAGTLAEQCRTLPPRRRDRKEKAMYISSL